MKVATWKTFLSDHPDYEELNKAAPLIHSLIDPDDTLDKNLERITSSQCIVIVTNDTFSETPLPVFCHHRLSLPIQGSRTRLVGLTGFGSRAAPVEIEAVRLFTLTETEMSTPSLTAFFSEAEKGLDALKDIKPDDNEKHHIRLAAVLFPHLVEIVAGLEAPSAWNLLFQAIMAIKRLKPRTVIDVDEPGEGEGNETGDDPQPETAAAEGDLDYAKPFLPLLLTLWSFTGSTEETKSIVPPRKSASINRRVSQWCQEMHDQFISSQEENHHHHPTQQPDNPTQHTTDPNIVECINRLAKSMEDSNNEKFGPSNENDEKENKGWIKLEDTFKKIILFAMSNDGETAAIEPTSRFKTILNSKNGAIVSRLISNWHQLDIIVQTGMASNIQKGSLLSDNSPFSITNFSPFFTPPARAGFSAISNLELNSLDFALHNHNMSDKDIQKMVHAKPYIPTQPHLFIAQLKNWHAVLSDIFSPTALITTNVQDIITNYNNNELLYYNMFEEEPDFSVWFLNQVHFKTQRILHQCASADAVSDVSFHQFNFEEELRCIGMNSVHAKAPIWYQKLQLDSKPKRSTTSDTRDEPGGNNSTGRDDRNQRRTINNSEKDATTKLKENEKYSFVCHRQNLLKCRDSEVAVNGEQICNNWHIRGWCHNLCQRKSTHAKLTGSTLEQYRSYVRKLRQATEDFRRNLARHRSSNSTPSSTRSNTTTAGETN